MLIGIQIFGLLFIAIMIYLTYLNYKRHNYGSKSFFLWITIWIIAAIIAIFPNMTYNFMEILNIQRTQDFFFMGAIIILFITVFHMYITIKKTHAKVEKLVRERAIKNPQKKTKKKK